MITWHRRAVLPLPLARTAVPGRAAARGRGGGHAGGVGEDGERLDVVRLVLLTGAGVVTEHDSPDWLGRERIPTGADTLTPGGQRARPGLTGQVASPLGVGRFLEQIGGFLNGF